MANIPINGLSTTIEYEEDISVQLVVGAKCQIEYLSGPEPTLLVF